MVNAISVFSEFLTLRKKSAAFTDGQQKIQATSESTAINSELGAFQTESC
jgi:hypothetical protein